MRHGIWPQLEQKEIVDLVNGIEVVGEIVNFKKTRVGFLRSAAALLSGREGRERDAIEEGLIEGQMTLVHWLHYVQSSQIATDLAVETVTRKLIATRQQLTHMSAEVKSRLDAMENSIERERERISDLVNGVTAQVVMQRIFKEVEGSTLPPLVVAFAVADRLCWSEFGTFVRQPGSHQKLARELSDLATQSLSKLLCSRMGESSPSRLNMHGMVEQCKTLTEPDKSIVDYLACGGEPFAAPIYYLLSSTAGLSQAWPQSLPQITSPVRIADRLIHESQWVAKVRANNDK